MEFPRPAPVQEKTRTVLRPRGDLGPVRRRAQAEHDGALRFHDHHASKHANGNRRIVDLDFAAIALPPQPGLHGLGGAAKSQF